MEQLSGLDAAFIHQDSSRTPMHISAALVYDCGTDGSGGNSRDELIELCRRRLQHFPLVRRRLRRIPMGVDAPYWREISQPDWPAHITETSQSVAGNAGWRQLQDTLAALHSQRMPLDRPLWQIHLIHDLRDIPGLPAHCQVLVLKVHHAAIDGIAMAAVINALHEPNTGDIPAMASTSGPPSQWELWSRVNFNQFGRQLKLAETMGNLLPGFVRARQARREFSDLPPVQSSGNRFNRRVRGGRHTGALLVPLARVAAVKKAVRRVTLNDIALAIVSGALREYLGQSGELPVRSLACGVPINLRSPGDSPAEGNRIATMIVGLATNIKDPVERLRAIHRYAVAGKKQINALGTGTVMDISDSLAPGMLAEGIRTMAWASQLADLPVPFHTMVSNVPGPTSGLLLGSARLAAPMGLGPVRDNMGLFHIVSNSESVMSLSFSACRRLLPDPDYYEACLQRSFEELYRASGA
jgi:WS/DGAT/MGAT family acyltransferase